MWGMCGDVLGYVEKRGAVWGRVGMYGMCDLCGNVCGCLGLCGNLWGCLWLCGNLWGCLGLCRNAWLCVWECVLVMRNMRPLSDEVLSSVREG